MPKLLANTEKKEIFNNETINSNFTSIKIDSSFTEQSFLLQFEYFNGVGPVDMILDLELSGDGINFVPLTDYSQQITDTSGVIVFDVALSAAEFVRFSITHTSGTIDANGLFVGKRRY